MKDFIQRYRKNKLKIVVVGDSMIDEYHQVVANRISPEFPIPVMKSKELGGIKLPGGAANVAYQFSNFPNIEVKLVSFLDQESLAVIDAYGINRSLSLVLDQGFSIPCKKRYYDGNFPLCRWDVEKENYGLENNDSCQNLFNKFLEADYKPDIIIFSDYHKGVFFDLDTIKNWMSLSSVFKIVDPKFGPVNKWDGCDLFKLNFKEAYDLTMQNDWERQACRLADRFRSRKPNIVITKGGDGCLLFDHKRHRVIKTEYKTEVESVIGAGDCFVCFLAVSKGLKYNIYDACQIAYKAGAKYIRNKHNKPLHPTDLLDKFVQPEDLIDRNFDLVFTNGVFDLLHPSHIELFEFAKSKGSRLVVALNSDESVKRLKGASRPINNLDIRMRILSSLSCVDFVISFDEDTPYEVIKSIKPNKIVKGGDYSVDDVVGLDIVGKDNILIFPYCDLYSTSKIIEKIKADQHMVSFCNLI